jgi:hypothetical protein
MQLSNVLIHCRRRLGATIAIRVAKIQRADAVLAQVHLNAVPPLIGLVV